MKKVFIQGVGSISSQKTFNNDEFLKEVSVYNDNVISVIDPVYKDYIPPAAARRMAKGIKMSTVASRLALLDAELDNVDAIITGTGMGCLVDSEKFVSALIDNKEEYLTPTSFIQSTHNTVGGQIALGLKCKGYNFTYVHGSSSFEASLIDAKMQLEENEAGTILVGGVDELGAHTVKIHKLIHHIKSTAVSSKDLLTSKTEGAVFSEGANFFVLANENKPGSYAELIDTDIFNTMSKQNLPDAILEFLKKNDLRIEDIDVLGLGNNGDIAFDGYYDALSNGIFANTQQIYYKHLCGEFNTASSFGTWLASKILKEQHIPKEVVKNNFKATKLETILLYNQYRGENHSFTLLRKC